MSRPDPGASCYRPRARSPNSAVPPGLSTPPPSHKCEARSNCIGGGETIPGERRNWARTGRTVCACAKGSVHRPASSYFTAVTLHSLFLFLRKFGEISENGGYAVLRGVVCYGASVRYANRK